MFGGAIDRGLQQRCERKTSDLFVERHAHFDCLNVNTVPRLPETAKLSRLQNFQLAEVFNEAYITTKV